MHFQKKKSDDVFVNNLNFGGERGKSKFQKKHGLVLCLTLSFESYLGKTRDFFLKMNLMDLFLKSHVTFNI